MLSRGDSAVALHRMMVKQREEDEQIEQKLLFALLSPPQLSFFFSFQSTLSITAIVPSIWNMQIADSAFACWCLTFPLEVAHRLNYAPYLQSVYKHLLSSHTPPPSANPTSAHLMLATSVQRQLGQGEDGCWVGEGCRKKIKLWFGGAMLPVILLQQLKKLSSPCKLMLRSVTLLPL
ncbi:hypothetical protein XENORESO_019283 [Xenotaenia resolanae]|uniref:Uncharacterized protein n=1 Tax=Xenotaenia resolanae TaxID=208358 RepID=A0ABV0W5F7_9TELE